MADDGKLSPTAPEDEADESFEPEEGETDFLPRRRLLLPPAEEPLPVVDEAPSVLLSSFPPSTPSISTLAPPGTGSIEDERDPDPALFSEDDPEDSFELEMSSVELGDSVFDALSFDPPVDESTERDMAAESEVPPLLLLLSNGAEPPRLLVSAPVLVSRPELPLPLLSC